MNNWSLFNLRLSTNYFIVLIILAVLAIYACATAPKVKMYPGDKLEDSKQAIIRGEERTKERGKITITQVDGEKTIDFFTQMSIVGGASEVYVLPGKHRIVTRIDHDTSYAFGYLWLVAEPGETYIVRARLEGYNAKMRLERERDGQNVGGIIGSDDKPK